MSLIDEFKEARQAGTGGDSEHAEFCFWLDENSNRIEKALEAGQSLFFHTRFNGTTNHGDFWKEIDKSRKDWQEATK